MCVARCTLYVVRIVWAYGTRARGVSRRAAGRVATLGRRALRSLRVRAVNCMQRLNAWSGAKRQRTLLVGAGRCNTPIPVSGQDARLGWQVSGIVVRVAMKIEAPVQRVLAVGQPTLPSSLRLASLPCLAQA